ncbi:MAG: hypothetical protein RMJ53_10920 [Chitinophagales bacterium]|nr:hypothetical protein [Chitinophagales bacterium]MDW8274730.1 hypothetical protein [Chitinophagales bacterium]
MAAGTDEKNAFTPLRLTLRNGNIIDGRCELKQIKFTTAYGLLTIPIKDISDIYMGILVDHKIKQKVSAYVDLLHSAKEQECKKVFKNLVNAEIEAIPVLEEIEEQDDFPYPQYSVSAALVELKEKFGVEEASTQDVVILNQIHSFPGVIDIQIFKIYTDYGFLEIPRNAIKSVEVLIANTNETKKNFKLQANTHIMANPQGGWLNTGIKLRKGQLITIESQGEIKLASLSDQPHKPDGSYLPPNSSWVSGNDADPNASPVYGNVIFKIGETGAVKKAGSKYSAKAYGNGILFLSIYETVFNESNSGHYNVTVKVL